MAQQVLGRSFSQEQVLAYYERYIHADLAMLMVLGLEPNEWLASLVEGIFSEWEPREEPLVLLPEQQAERSAILALSKEKKFVTRSSNFADGGGMPPIY